MQSGLEALLPSATEPPPATVPEVIPQVKAEPRDEMPQVKAEPRGDDEPRQVATNTERIESDFEIINGEIIYTI